MRASEPRWTAGPSLLFWPSQLPSTPPPPLPDSPHRCTQGHVEAGENLVQTALRELTEETGLVTAGGAITVCAIGILFLVLVSCVHMRARGLAALANCPSASQSPQASRFSWPAP